MHMFCDCTPIFVLQLVLHALEERLADGDARYLFWLQRDNSFEYVSTNFADVGGSMALPASPATGGACYYSESQVRVFFFLSFLFFLRFLFPSMHACMRWLGTRDGTGLATIKVVVVIVLVFCGACDTCYLGNRALHVTKKFGWIC